MKWIFFTLFHFETGGDDALGHPAGQAPMGQG
jgi:hypothetical protein